MFGQIGRWYRKQKAGIKLGLTFLCNFLFWLVVEIVTYRFSGEKKSTTTMLLGTCIMAVIWTTLMDWRKVKAAFQKEPAA